MKVPTKIAITITAEGAPLANVPVMLTFTMARKNHHRFVFGPSDESGTIYIGGDEIRRQARGSMELFLMDYANIDAHWTGTLRATPMKRDAIKWALSAYRQFLSHEFPPGYEQMRLAADVILSKIPTATLGATVRCEPEKMFTVEAVPVRAG